MSHAIDNRHIDSVRDGVAALHRAPGIVLGGPKGLLFARMPANRRGVKQNGCAAQRCQAGGFGIPLVPADERPDASHVRLEGPKTEVTGSEVELLIVGRIVRNVHLAIQTDHAPVCVDDGGAVVIHARSAPLEDRRDNCDLLLLRDLG